MAKYKQVLLECGFTPAQIDLIRKHNLIDKAKETASGDMPQEVKELLGLRGC